MKKVLVLCLFVTLLSASLAAVTSSEARQIALQDAGVADTFFIRVERDGAKYEVEFTSDGIEYDYEIDILTGEIYEKSVDLKNTRTLVGSPVTREEAEAIAFEVAGASSADVIGLMTRLDYDDKRQEYEVHFIYGNWQFDVDVDVLTGVVTSADKKLLRYAPVSGGSGNGVIRL